MKPLIRPCVLFALLSTCILLSGCSKNDPLPAAVSSQATATPSNDLEHSMAALTVPTEDPCQLLTDAEVGKVFSGAASGERERSLEGNGILTCVWDTPTDRFIVQTFKGKSGTVKDELRSRVSGSVDPLTPGAGDRIRYETIAGIGNQAMLVVEKADPQRGILADMAVLVMQRGERRVVLFTGTSLAGGERASGLKSLETLGAIVMKRL